MDEVREASVFETRNVDLASYLVLEGVKLLELKKSNDDPRVVVLRFIDSKQNCLDLERVFLNSEMKKFRDINKWLLSKIHEKKRE